MVLESKYDHVRTAMARVHGWVGTEKQHRRRVHGEPTGWVGTECIIVFIRRAWTEQAMKTRPCVPHNGGNGLVFDRPRSKRGPVDREGCGIPQNGGNGPPTVETGVLLNGVPQNGGNGPPMVETGPVDREGCGVPQNRGNGLVLERYGRNGGPVHREGCCVPQN